MGKVSCGFLDLLACSFSALSQKLWSGWQDRETLNKTYATLVDLDHHEFKEDRCKPRHSASDIRMALVSRVEPVRN